MNKIAVMIGSALGFTAAMLVRPVTWLALLFAAGLICNTQGGHVLSAVIAAGYVGWILKGSDI